MARTILCLMAAAGAAIPALAQQQEPPQTVVITGRGPVSAGVGGFDDVPLARAPFAATVFGPQALADAGVANLADITRVSAGLADAYNAVGYWSGFTVRGFVLDPRTNFRRDGLPINAETSLWLGNKQSLEILRGTSGMQAGVSAPGGLVNLVVKRPDARYRSATLGFEERATYRIGIDLGEKAGAGTPVGWRISAEHEHLDPTLRDARGKRQGLAAAADWSPASGSLLEAEVELNRQSQPSQPGFSLLGGTVPDARSVDPKLNLNNQPWTLPVVFNGRTASLRWTQQLAPTLQLSAHAMTQRLRTDDRIAFPFGCGAEGNFDRYCSDGTFDFYDYRSDGERRRNDALDLALGGRATAFGQDHRWRTGVLLTRRQADLPPQAFNFVGTGTVDGRSVVPPDPTLDPAAASARDERSTEWYARDQWQVTSAAGLWLGLRHTQLKRTDSSQSIDATQRFTTPWVAGSLQLSASTLVYASAGQGIESTVVPNLAGVYENPGRPLPALKSHQLEAGVKHDAGALSASATVFDIRRPLFSDVPSGALLSRVIDGRQRHRGVELEAAWRGSAWSLQGSATALRARRERAIDPANNGLKPANVPERSLRALVDYRLPAWPALTLTAGAVHEGARVVLPDNSATIPAWTRLDLGARLEQRLGETTLIWRLGVDNATDKRAWRESPYQFGHAYLYPLAPRTWRASVQAAI